MAKKLSKSQEKAQDKSQKKSPKQSKPKGIKLHHSFKRSYREDYQRSLKVPGFMQHTVNTFKILFKNWRLFLPLVILAVILSVVLVGIMNEEAYQEFQTAFDETNESYGGRFGNFAKAGLLLISTVATGGLNQEPTAVQEVFNFLILLILWLVTVYLLRHILAGKKLKLRDALYNALAPLLSTLCVAIVFVLELIPILIVVITYSAAVSTEFLSTPFYAFIYFVFAVLMVILSLYLVSSTLIAMIAVSAPGVYPMAALRTGRDVLAGRRIKFIARILFLILVIAFIYIIIMLPLMLLDMWLKSSFDFLANVPFVSICLLATTVFAFIYASAYLFLFYRRMIESDND